MITEQIIQSILNKDFSKITICLKSGEVDIFQSQKPQIINGNIVTKETDPTYIIPISNIDYLFYA